MNIILAAGNQTRWNYEPPKGMILPNIKQLVPIGDKTLIEDIQDKFPGVVVTKSQEIKNKSKQWFEPENNEVTLATLFSTKDLWDDITTILLGDVLYGRQTIKLIKNQKEPLMFYGDKGEIYAIKFSLQASVNIILAISKIVNSPYFKPKFGKLWNLYRALEGVDFRKEYIGRHFTFVKDCRDFDNKRQYIKYANSKQVRR